MGIINKGRIIALDEPRRLCESMGSTAVEFMSGGKTHYRYFPDREKAKAFVSSLDGDNVLIRNTNLEDVFVELTGGSSVGDQR